MRRSRSPAVAARVARAVPRQGEEPPQDDSPCPSLSISSEIIRGTGSSSSQRALLLLRRRLAASLVAVQRQRT